MAPPQTNIQHKTQPKNKKSYKYNVAIFIIKIIQMLLCSHIILNLNYLQHYNNTANIQSPLQFLPQSREKNKKIKLFDEKKNTRPARAAVSACRSSAWPSPPLQLPRALPSSFVARRGAPPSGSACPHSACCERCSLAA
jgi:hypothetical protein